jgi:cytochrome c5
VNPSRLIFAATFGLSMSLIPVIMGGQTQAAATQQPVAKTSTQSQQAQKKNTHPVSEGERIFAQNCSRCHNAPEGFSPSISGTVVRHMRVRAQLSQHDEQELLRFFNP